jgi:hypothetical protein
VNYNFNDYARTKSINKRNEFINVNFENFDDFVCFGSALMRVNESYLKIVNDYPNFDIDVVYPESVSALSVSSVTLDKLIEFYNNCDCYTLYLFNKVFNGLSAYTISAMTVVDAGYNNSVSGIYYGIPIVYRDANKQLLDENQWSAIVEISASAEAFDRENTNTLLKRFGDYLTQNADNEDFQKLLYIIGRFFDEQRILVKKTSDLYNPDWLVYNYPSYKQVLLLQDNFNIEIGDLAHGPLVSEFLDSSSRDSVTNVFLNKKIMHRILSNYA